MSARAVLLRPSVPRTKAPLALLATVAVVGAVVLIWRFVPWLGSGIVEHRLPTSTDIPTAVAVGPDGAIWFTLESSTAIGVMRGGTLSKIERGQKSLEPFGIAVDADGHVWQTDSQLRAISRLATDGTLTSFPLANPASKLGRLTIAPDGAVWFADGDQNSIVRLKDGVFTPHELPSFNARPFGVAIAPDGTVWATLQRIHRLARLLPDGTMTELDLPTRGGEPVDIVVDRAGVVWFTQLRGNKIGRYADGSFSEFAVPTAQAGVTAIALAPDGAIWFTETRGPKLGRLRNGVVTEIPLPSSDARPLGIAVDQEGNVWYTDLKGNLGMLPAGRASAG